MKHVIKFNEAVTKLHQTVDIYNARNILWKVFSKDKCGKACGKNIRILILSAPCMGMGDIVFSKKIGDYMRQWYGAKVTIATTKPLALHSLNSRNIKVMNLESGHNPNCRRFKKLNISGNLPQQDLIFVAPITSEFNPVLQDVKYLIPYASKTNTFFFSEYNNKWEWETDFPTGIGGNKMGLLLTEPTNYNRYRKLKNPYVMTYIANQHSVPRANRCMLAFLEMVAKKYHLKHSKLDVVLPAWTFKEYDHFYYEHSRKLLQYYSKIMLKLPGKKAYIIVEKKTRKSSRKTSRKSSRKTSRKKESVLTFRTDIYPVANTTMTTLFRYSLDDVLVTGDQSFTDVISCCASKNIFYQIAEWKKSFSRYLAKLLPNKYLLKKSTSCGSMAAIRYESDYKGFVKKWDFRINARPKLNGIILAAKAQQENKNFRILAADIDEARGYGTLAAIDRLKQLY